MGMIRFLEQVNQNDPRGWNINFGLARVKEFKFDKFT